MGATQARRGEHEIVCLDVYATVDPCRSEELRAGNAITRSAKLHEGIEDVPINRDHYPRTDSFLDRIRNPGVKEKRLTDIDEPRVVRNHHKIRHRKKLERVDSRRRVARTPANDHKVVTGRRAQLRCGEVLKNPLPAAFTSKPTTLDQNVPVDVLDP